MGFQEMCIDRNTNYYRFTCDKSLYRDKVPRGKNGRRVDVGVYCNRKLREKTRGEFNMHANWEEYYNSLDPCEKLGLDLCMEQYEQDHPDSTGQNTIEVGVEYVLKAGFKTVKEVHWGGTKGFYSACVEVGSMMDNECTRNQASCFREVSPDSMCRYYNRK